MPGTQQFPLNQRFDELPDGAQLSISSIRHPFIADPKILPHFRHVRRVRRAELEPLHLVEMFRRSVQIAVASRVLLRPALQLCPIAALPMLSEAALRFVNVTARWLNAWKVCRRHWTRQSRFPNSLGYFLWKACEWGEGCGLPIQCPLVYNRAWML